MTFFFSRQKRCLINKVFDGNFIAKLSLKITLCHKIIRQMLFIRRIELKLRTLYNHSIETRSLQTKA